MISKNTILNCLLIAVACLIGVFIAEVGARLILNPADYLSVTAVPDDQLGMVINSGSKGFDDWGFRNREVPTKSDIVAIGDSHTYGNTAKGSESWPAILENISELSVYNMGMGGYGPNQYFYLFNEKALLLKPKIVLCGLYMGDDFENAFSITYGLDYWSFLREGIWHHVESDIWNTTKNDHSSLFKLLRNYLSRQSLLYRLTVHGPIFGKIKGYIEIRNPVEDEGITTYLIEEDKNIREAFRPINMLNRLNQENPLILEGMRITFNLLNEMKKTSDRHNIEFIVVVIPTKEMVFSDYLENNPGIRLQLVIKELLSNEKMARKQLFDFLQDRGILFVDTLPDLRQNVSNRLYAFTDKDMHPGKNGYSVIAESVYRSLKDFELTN
jgi:hypothetical protein